MNEVINIEEKLNLFSDLWSPKRIEKLNGQQVILAKVKGEFVSSTNSEHTLESSLLKLPIALMYQTLKKISKIMPKPVL